MPRFDQDPVVDIQTVYGTLTATFRDPREDLDIRARLRMDDPEPYHISVMHVEGDCTCYGVLVRIDMDLVWETRARSADPESGTYTTLTPDPERNKTCRAHPFTRKLSDDLSAIPPHVYKRLRDTLEVMCTDTYLQRGDLQLAATRAYIVAQRYAAQSAIFDTIEKLYKFQTNLLRLTSDLSEFDAKHAEDTV